MKSSLAADLTTTRRIVIDTARTIDFMGDEGRVYATPELVRDIEITCRDFLLEHLDPGEDSVGTRIEIDHMAPTLIGMAVEITVTIAELNKRAVVFEVTAKDPMDAICKGRHARFVVDVNATKERLRAKAAKVAGG